MTESAPVHRSMRLPRNVYVLGVVSLLTDMASEMLYPVIPLFVTGVLGASPAVLGLIDGCAEGLSTVLRFVAGALSDRFRRRKPFVVAGYAISALSKPVMGLAAAAVGWPLFFVARATDRVGKSVRTGARDALISDSTPAGVRGLAFGVHRAMDTTGAVLGPLVAVGILAVVPHVPLARLFYVALVPGLLSALVCLLAVKDVPHVPRAGAMPPPIFQHYPRALYLLLVAAGVFSLGNSSDSFLLLRSKELGLSTTQVILAFTVYNVVYAAAAAPLGRLSDRVGRKGVIAAGWGTYAAVYFGFAAARGAFAPWALLAVYGVYQALTEGVTKALVSDLVPAERRGGAIGLFYTVTGLGQLLASLVAGWVWARSVGGLHLPFLLGAVFAAAGVAALVVIPVRAGRGDKRVG